MSDDEFKVGDTVYAVMRYKRYCYIIEKVEIRSINGCEILKQLELKSDDGTYWVTTPGNYVFYTLEGALNLITKLYAHNP